MRHERATDEIRELAALYALGSLTQHEARSFEIHLKDGCSVCEAELHTFENIVAGIGFTVEEAAAPEYLRDLLLARIERETTETPAPLEPSRAPETKKPPEAKPQQRSIPKPIFTQPPPERSGFFLKALALMLALLALLAGYAWKNTRDVNIQLEATLKATKTDTDDIRRLMFIQKDRIEDLEKITSLLCKPGARALVLVGQPVDPSASGAIFWDTERNLWLVIGKLAQPPEGKIYTLWFVTSTAKIPAGTLKPNPAGRIFTTIDVPREIASLAGAVVTLEPDNGSQIPSMPFYSIGRFN